jgi:capsid protein
MARNSDAFSDTFIEGLRRDTARWKAELSLLDVGVERRGKYLQTSELRSWIEAGEKIFARYERRRG